MYAYETTLSPAHAILPLSEAKGKQREKLENSDPISCHCDAV